MATITAVFTLARVAELLGEEDWLHEISIEMEPEDGILSVYGPGNDYTPGFSAFGIKNLRELILIHKNEARPTSAEPEDPAAAP